MPHEHTTFIIHRAVLFLSADGTAYCNMFPYLIHAAKLHVAWMKARLVQRPSTTKKLCGVYIPVESTYHSIRGISILPLNTVHWEKLSHSSHEICEFQIIFARVEWMECTIQWQCLQWGSIRS